MFCTPEVSDSSGQPSPLTPGGFTDLPPLPVFHRNHTRRLRDSVLTQNSVASSSIYPPSTITSATTESVLSAPSMSSQPHQDVVVAVDPDDYSDMHHIQEFDADDVSYRLRLLVQNNYYLPPAHSKPYPTNFSILSEPPKKSNSPAFLDYFRVGRSRSKSSTPDGTKANKNARPPLPMLRTTADSFTISDSVRVPGTKTMPHSPLSRGPYVSPQPDNFQSRKGRVVVVREKVNDLMDAVAQAEHGLQTQKHFPRTGRSRSSLSRKDDDHYDHIDPTDIVDLPPSSNRDYPFWPQASALNGFGVGAAVGADILAECLPPGSPGVWSVDPEEEKWRKALLHEAVGHSLNNSPAHTANTSRITSASQTSPIDVVHETLPAAPPVRTKRLLGQPILTQVMDLNILSQQLSEPTTCSTILETPQVPLARDRIPSATYSVLGRAETPLPTTPLAPPPLRNIRRQTMSDDGLVAEQREESGVTHSQILRKMMSTPTLPYSNQTSDDLGVDEHYLEGLVSRRSPASAIVVEMNADVEPTSTYPTRLHSISSGSIYSDDCDGVPFHTAEEQQIDEAAISRPSLTGSSVYSIEDCQPSPTISAFRDAAGASHVSRTPTPQRISSDYHGQASYMPSNSRFNGARAAATSPPPRASSSFSPMALSPAPRPAASHATTSMRPSFSSWHSSPGMNDRSFRSSEIIRESLDSPDIPNIVEPSTPRASIAFRRSMNLANLNLMVPGQQTDSSQTMAYPPSPISFFDEVEMHHRDSMEDWSDDEGAQASPTKPVDHSRESVPTHVTAPDPEPSSATPVGGIDSQSLKSMFNLGNGSKAHSIAASVRSAVSYDAHDRRPVSNVPPPSASPPRGPQLFNRREKSRERMKVGVPDLASAALKYGRPATSPGRPATSPGWPPPQLSIGSRPKTSGSQNIHSWRRDQSMQDQTMRRLDGLMLEHVEQERNAMRRIARTMKVAQS